MDIIRSSQFTADRAWGSKCIASMRGITTKLHWTNKPYRWHTNDGEEVFAVLSGQVRMYYRLQGEEYSQLLAAGDIFYADQGTEHCACPVGEARILVVEKEGSI